ncbi:MAG: Spy/CpxP family protein refolding chaperone [Gemmatimonadota bacterium]
MRTFFVPAVLLVFVVAASSPAVAQDGDGTGMGNGRQHQMQGHDQGGMQGMGGGMLGGISAQEKEALLKGSGLGAGMIAMMNGYPGPKHVLEMGDELELTAAQREEIGTIFGEAKASFVELGTTIVEKDEALTALFTSGSATTAQVETLAREIGDLQGQLRAGHLNAHIRTYDALTPAQREKLSSMQEMHGMHEGQGEGKQEHSRMGQTSDT